MNKGLSIFTFMAMLSAVPFSAAASKNVEPELCFLEIYRAYKNAETTGSFSLENPLRCGKYKGKYDRKYRPDDLPVYVGEEAFELSYTLQPEDRVYEWRKNCSEKLRHQDYSYEVLSRDEDCLAFLAAMETLPIK